MNLPTNAFIPLGLLYGIAYAVAHHYAPQSWPADLALGAIAFVGWLTQRQTPPPENPS